VRFFMYFLKKNFFWGVGEQWEGVEQWENFFGEFYEGIKRFFLLKTLLEKIFENSTDLFSVLNPCVFPKFENLILI